MSYYPLNIEECMHNAHKGEINFLDKIPVKHLSLFCHQLSIVIRSGIPISQALNLLYAQIDHIGLKKLIWKLHEDIQKGHTLSQSMIKHKKQLPEILINMVQAGEFSGTLDSSLEQMSKYFSKEHKIKRKIVEALAYPILVCTITIFVVFFFISNILPMYASVFTQNNIVLPKSTQIMLSIANFINGKWDFVIVFIVSIIAFIKILLSNKKIKYKCHKIRLRAPFKGRIELKIITARFASAMATLTAAGIPLSDSLLIAAGVVNNTAAKYEIAQVKNNIEKGINLSEAIDRTKFFPPILVHMLRVGEVSGNVTQMLDKVAQIYEDDVDSSLAIVANLIEPVVIVILGIIIGFIVIAVAMPMFQMMDFIH